MIYVVDEDEIQMEPFLLEMRFRGHDIKLIRTADRALRALHDIAESDYLFIDVMLAPNAVAGNSVFGREETYDYKTTGLRLVELILDQRPSFPRTHIVLMSQAGSKWLVEKIESFALRYHVHNMWKSRYDDPLDFGVYVDEIVNQQQDHGNDANKS